MDAQVVLVVGLAWLVLWVGVLWLLGMWTGGEDDKR